MSRRPSAVFVETVCAISHSPDLASQRGSDLGGLLCFGAREIQDRPTGVNPPVKNGALTLQHPLRPSNAMHFVLAVIAADGFTMSLPNAIGNLTILQ